MRQRKGLFLLLFLLSFLLVAGPAFAQGSKQPAFVGNKSSKKYHVTTCRMAKVIAPKNRIEFQNAKEAEDLGYVACKICKPNKKKS